MKIKLTSVLVDDQAKALSFYTEKLGFVKKQDIPMGPVRWLTVVSPSEPEGVQLLLEPMGHAFAATYQKELYAAGIPLTAFFVDDLPSEYARLKALGVVFRGEPKTIPGGPTIAVLEDTCGNLLQLVQG
ncbi:VOC family protein [Cystobacter ferrugineus]|uniref:Glyoxalase n=1 Tax=Cystobacter ferrugineus TaxID=83449 RepID=A0A1L9AV74_9BACT|nr:VOC family protein [Cystobacter ferrugineus]OJH33833.1 glyoxalase [Cystobacter ferrugineus]